MTKYDITYSSTKVGRGTITVNGYFLHSKYDPIKEAIRFIDKEINEQFLTIIFGLGKGYIVDILSERQYSSNKIIIIEPITELESIGDTKDFTVIKSNDMKAIREIIEQRLTHFSKEIQVVNLPNYDKICTVEYKELLKTVKEIQMLNVVNENTVRRQSEFWQENQIKNTLYAYCNHSLDELEGKYNIPVVVASGGPSLIKQLPLLRKIRSNIVLIASGSTVITLQKEGFIPDYIASIDGNKGNYERHFLDNEFGSTQLIYSFSNHFEIQKHFPNASYAFVDINQSDLVNQLNKRYDFKEIPQLEGGGSVANYALSIARYISTGPIALIGQDLAYTNNQTHANHNLSAIKVTDELIKKRGAFKVDGYFDEEVLTDYSLFSMKKRFEEIIQTIKQPETIFNCTEGGVKIAGMKQISFEEFSVKFVESSIKKEIVMPAYKKRNIAKLIDIYLNELKKYNEIIVDAKSAMRLLDKVKEQGAFSQKILKELDKIDANIKIRKEKILMDSILSPLIMDVMLKYQEKSNETKEEKFKRAFAQNEELYSRLYIATEQSKKFIKEVLEEAREMRGYSERAN